MIKYSIVRPGNNCRIELFCGDCIEGMSSHIEERSVDVIVTSPPYNIGVQYSSYNDKQPRDSYLAWIEEWAIATKRVLSEDGSIFLNVGGKPSDPWVPIQVADILRRHFNLQNVIHWIKSIAIDSTALGKGHNVNGDLSFGHYKPINSKAFVNDLHEYVFHFTHSGKLPIDRLALGVPYQDKSNVKRWKAAAKDVRCRGNVWFIPYETIRNRDKQRPHPASYPPRLAEMCLQLHGVRNDLLALDPFMGLGSTAIACARLGVNCVGFEMDREYHATSIKRVSEESCCQQILWTDENQDFSK